MPVMEQGELEQVYQSVSGFAEDALRYAIEQAKDPDKAMQLIERLEQELAKEPLDEPFAVIALAVVLGEAKVESAIPVLLSMEETAGKTGGLIQEAATYALQRMGTPALMATMTHIENAADPLVRAKGYAILHAAMDADEPTRLAVQEFSLSRVKIEVQQLQETKNWQPLRAALSVSAVLGDQRVKPTLEELASQAKSSGEDEEAEELNLLLDDLASGERWDYDVDWRTDWPAQCEEWNGMLQDWWQQEANAAKIEELKAVHAELAESYRQSLVQEGIPADAAEVAKKTVVDWLDLAARHGLDARNPDLELTREVLMEHSPAELLGDRRYFEGLPSLVEAFYVFLHNTGRLEDLKPYEQLFNEARKSLPDLGIDRQLWGMRKLMYVVGTEQGYDMNNDAEAMEFMQNLVQSATDKLPEKEPSPAPPAEEYYGDRIEPIRRTEPKVGRNDPCPCGSGKKYKKCCGK